MLFEIGLIIQLCSRLKESLNLDKIHCYASPFFQNFFAIKKYSRNSFKREII